MTRVCGPEKSEGLEVRAGFCQIRRKIRLEMEFKNHGKGTANQFAIQLNKNAFGLSPASQQVVCHTPVQPGSTGMAVCELLATPNMLATPQPGQPANPSVQVAIKNISSPSKHVFYFAVPLNLEAIYSTDGAMERSPFIELWKSIDDRNELYGTVQDLSRDAVNVETVKERLAVYNIFFIARRPVPNAPGQEVVYFSMRTVTNMQFLAELTFKEGVNACKVCLKTENGSYGQLAKSSLEYILKNI